MVKSRFKIYFYLCLMAISSSMASETSDVETYNKAIALHKLGKVSESVERLKTITPGSAFYKSSLESLGKIYYRENLYSELFGLTTFYRTYYKNFDKTDLSLLALEILALGKLCQFESAESLLKDLESKAQEEKKLKKIEEINKIKKSYELVKGYAIKTDFEASDYRGKYQWKLNREDLSRLRDPYQLRVKVENKCQR